MTPDISERLRSAAASLPTERVTIGRLAQLHGGAAQATLLVLLAAPCMLPIPGVGSVFSLGLFLLALTLWQGADDAPVPERLARIELPGEWAARVLRLLATFYTHASRLAQPRWSQLAGTPAQRWVAPGTALMALLIFLPIPFGNILPAISLMLAGLALALRDGLSMLLAWLVGLTALGTSVGLLAFGAQWGATLLEAVL